MFAREECFSKYLLFLDARLHDDEFASYLSSLRSTDHLRFGTQSDASARTFTRWSEGVT